ncbi:MAG: VOC family protein [Desulfurococcales archaeon]|nr:VOC family protein [Desulfurococcales archaeon]
MLRHVGYIIVFVRDMDAMLDFWRNRIGLQPGYTSSEWSELQLDNTILALHKAEEAGRRDTGIVFTTQDIDGAVEKLRAAGVEVTDPQDIGAGREATFKDPEGNVYHIFQPAQQA